MMIIMVWMQCRLQSLPICVHSVYNQRILEVTLLGRGQQLIVHPGVLTVHRAVLCLSEQDGPMEQFSTRIYDMKQQVMHLLDAL
mmetsp:Transcript_3014/g.10175  ORF Transcript_3014/g.10175 Transcript_3014/m.10175 type:complete len:84 (+) Transcript_3014:798-1049(+)